jgi:uncharacterized membrane protein
MGNWVEDLMERIPSLGRLPYRAIALLLPAMVLLMHFLVMYATLGYTQSALIVGLMIAYILPPAGKETVIPVGIALGIPWWVIALAIAMVDIETGLFMALNLDLVYRIPLVGGPLARFTDTTKQFLEDHHWVANLSVLGIILMVMVPFLGSGGVRGSIAGKLLGLEGYMVFLAVLTGALLGCFLIALGSDAIIGYLCTSGLIPDLLAGVCHRG